MTQTTRHIFSTIFRRCLIPVLILTSLCTLACASGLMLPAGVITIEEEAFYGDTSLDVVILPEGLETIGLRAFAASSVKSLQIPASVTEIASDAFQDSTLEEVTAVYGTYGYEWAVKMGYLRQGPVILLQPNHVKGDVGDVVAFRTEAEGSGLSYQWLYRKTGREWHEAPDGTTAEFSFTVTEDLVGTVWKCRVTAPDGTWSETDVVRLNPTTVTKLTWVVGNSPAPLDNDLVLEELNKITREELGCEVDIIYMSSEEVTLSLLAEEIYDMYFTCPWFNNFNVNVLNGEFADIRDMVQEITPELYDTMPGSVWELASTGDALYAIPIKKDYAPMYFVTYDATVAEEAGISMPEKVDSLDELTDYLVALKNAMNQDPSLGTYPLRASDLINTSLESDFDYLDYGSGVGVSVGETTVHSVYEEERIQERYQVIRKWMEMGLIDPDPNASGNPGHVMRFVQAWTGYDYSQSNQYETKLVQYAGPYLTKDGVQGAMTAFSKALEEDPARFELCLKYQEFVNTNQNYRDILAYGIPGLHFNYADVTDGNGNVTGRAVVRTETGLNRYMPWSFAQGSYDVRTVEASASQLDGTLPAPVTDQWQQYFEQADTAPASAIGGFSLDTSAIQDAIQAVSFIRNEYIGSLHAGFAKPMETIGAMIQKMNEAGLQTIIQEAQKQLNAFLSGLTGGN